jgi:hypothetical protein
MIADGSNQISLSAGCTLQPPPGMSERSCKQDGVIPFNKW